MDIYIGHKVCIWGHYKDITIALYLLHNGCFYWSYKHIRARYYFMWVHTRNDLVLFINKPLQSWSAVNDLWESIWGFEVRCSHAFRKNDIPILFNHYTFVWGNRVLELDRTRMRSEGSKRTSIKEREGSGLDQEKVNAKWMEDRSSDFKLKIELLKQIQLNMFN